MQLKTVFRGKWIAPSIYTRNISDLHDLSYYLKNFKKLKPNRKKIKNRKQQNRTFLTVQWLRLHTPVQEAGVQSLIREDAAWWTQMKRKQ